MAIETDITKLVFNKMSQEKYEELKANGELVNNEFYITPDSNIDIDIPENVVEADNYVNAKLWKGTLAEYEALESYDDSVTYIITDDVVEGGTIVSVDAYTKSETDEFLNAKQDVLVSGTNIKTINGESILGEGDYVIDVDTSEIENNINTLNNELTTVKTDLNNKLDTTQITNCITDIPQDIKLELADGTLTLKAGSKIYYPNGFETDGTTPKFDVVVIESDVVHNYQSATTGQTMLFLYPSRAIGAYFYSGDAIFQGYYSGTTAPTGHTYMTWYDTANNFVKYTDNSGSTWTSGCSLPIAIGSYSNTWTSIDQVFNGFGYIGSTVFALPGVKGLIPDGRNADGSLKNKEFTLNSVLTKTTTATNTSNIVVTLRSSQLNLPAKTDYGYDVVKNINTWQGSKASDISISDLVVSNSQITSFTPKQPFQAVDRNNSSWVSAQAMPSDRYIDLTLGESSSSYTAPANGYYTISGTGFEWVDIANPISSIGYCTSPRSDGFIRLTLPVAQGQSVLVYYGTLPTDYTFRFVYAQGA